MTVGLLVIVAVAIASASGAQRVVAAPNAGRALQVRNPPALRAIEVLGRAEPGIAPRIRFEWESVAGASAYVLTGRWTNRQSWAVRSSEYRVTARNATNWRPGRVTFDVSLPEGSHSWQVVAIFEPHETGDFEHPARLSFEIR